MQENKTTRIAAYISLSGLLVLCIAALWYYKERMLFTDAAYIVFNIITEGTLRIQENRFGAFITQMVPLIGSKLHLPLKTILLSYSLSFNLFYLLVGVILVFILKQYRIAVLLGFYYLLFVSQSYFWTNNEIYQATAWMMLAFGVLEWRDSNKLRPLRWVLFIVLIVTAVFTHTGVTMVMCFLGVYYLLIQKQHLNFSSRIAAGGVIAFAVIVKLIMSSRQSYDGFKMQNVLKSNIYDVKETLFSNFTISFLQRCINNYWAVTLLFVCGIVYLLWHKKYKLVVLCGGATAVYYSLICLVFSEIHNIKLFYLESEIMGMAIIMSLPFVYYILPNIKPAYGIALLSIIISSRLMYIYQSADRYTKRIELTAHILQWMDKEKISKLGIMETATAKETMIEIWAAPTESIILSAINGKPYASFYFVKDSAAIANLPRTKDVFADVFYPYKPEDMNTRYFTIDTTSYYTIRHFNEIVP